MTRQELATRLGTTIGAVDKYAAKGLITPTKTKRKVDFPEAEVKRFENYLENRFKTTLLPITLESEFFKEFKLEWLEMQRRFNVKQTKQSKSKLAK